MKKSASFIRLVSTLLDNCYQRGVPVRRAVAQLYYMEMFADLQIPDGPSLAMQAIDIPGMDAHIVNFSSPLQQSFTDWDLEVAEAYAAFGLEVIRNDRPLSATHFSSDTARVKGPAEISMHRVSFSDAVGEQARLWGFFGELEQAVKEISMPEFAEALEVALLVKRLADFANLRDGLGFVQSHIEQTVSMIEEGQLYRECGPCVVMGRAGL